MAALWWAARGKWGFPLLFAQQTLGAGTFVLLSKEERCWIKQAELLSSTKEQITEIRGDRAWASALSIEVVAWTQHRWKPCRPLLHLLTHANYPVVSTHKQMMPFCCHSSCEDHAQQPIMVNFFVCPYFRNFWAKTQVPIGFRVQHDHDSDVPVQHLAGLMPGWYSLWSVGSCWKLNRASLLCGLVNPEMVWAKFTAGIGWCWIKAACPCTALGILPACMVEGALLVAAASHRDIMEKEEKPLGAFLGMCIGSSAKQPKAGSCGSSVPKLLNKSSAVDGAQPSRALGLIPQLESAHVSD